MNLTGQESFIHSINFPAVSFLTSQLRWGILQKRPAYVFLRALCFSFFDKEFIRHYSSVADFFVVLGLNREVVLTQPPVY